MGGQLFQEVHARVSAMDAARFYGMAFGKNRRAVCPWHPDTHPDLAFYDGGSRCYCHACHSGGDAIALCAQLFNLTPLQAARKLNADFHLGIDADAPYVPPPVSKRELRDQTRRRGYRLYSRLCDIERDTQRFLDTVQPGDEDNPLFEMMLRANAYAQEDLGRMQPASDEEMNEILGGWKARGLQRDF